MAAPQMPLSMGAPPPPPPEVTGQMGKGNDPMQAAAGSAAQGMVNPQGALLATAETVRKVIVQMGAMSPKFAPFADKMVQMLNAGLGEAAGGGDNAQAGLVSPASAASGGPTARPPSGAAGSAFPG